MDVYFVTSLEKKVIENIIDIENLVDVKDAINFAPWCYNVTNNDRHLEEALNSLFKKGFVFIDEEENEDSICCLTEKGANWVKNNIKI